MDTVFNCKGFGHYAKECRNPKRVKDYSYHKEKMTMCKQAKQGVLLQAEQADWPADTDEEIDEHELEAHYRFKTDENNVFANERRHSEQPKSINDTYVLEKDDSNVTPDSSNICNNDNQVDQNAAECVDERAALANLIANLTLDTEENKTILKQLKKANASLTQETEGYAVTTSDRQVRASGEATSCRDSCLIALQNKHNEFEKYKAFNDRTIDYDILQTKLNETLGLLARKDIDIKEGLKTKAYEILVVNQKHDELVKRSLLTKSQFEGQLKEKSKVISDLKVKEEKDIDKMIEMDKQLKFLNEIVYTRNQSIQTIHMLAPKCSTYNGRPTFANPRYLKKAQSEKPCLYEIPYDNSDHANRFAPDREETMTLANESRSKLNKDYVKPYDYTRHNSLYEIFKAPSLEYLYQLERAKEVRKDKVEKTVCQRGECLAQKLLKQTDLDSVNKEVHNKLLKSFAKLENHSISLELALQQCKEQMKNNSVCKENGSNVFRKEREQYHEIQDLKAQMQDKNIAISELKKLIKKCKGKSVETQFDKPSVVRQPNAQRIPKPSVLGKPTPFSNSPEMRSFQTKQSVNKTNVSDGLFKQVTQQNLPQNRKQAEIHSNVLKPGMYRIATTTTQTRTPQLPHASRNTNPHVSKSTGVNHYTSVSRPQLKSYQVKDKVVPNNSQVKFNHKEVEEHHRISSISRKTKSVTACNDSSKSRTLNVNAVCAECGKCVFNSNHDACVSRYLNDVNARTKKPKVVPISASKPKRKANKSVATPHKKTEWKWWIAKRCPSGYKWTQKPLRTKKIWMPKIRKDDVSTSISPTIDIVSRITNVLKISNSLGSNLSNVPSSSNSLADYTTHPIHCTVHFGNDQFAPILGYGDLNQGNIMIKRVYYVEGLNHNLFLVGQFCDADLEVAFRKSTCFVRDLQGNDLLTASPTQAWLWHRRLSHLNFDYITLLSKKDIVTGLPKLKYVKDQLCSSCEMSKAKRSSFKSKAVPSSKGRLNLLHMDLCGPMRVASINGKKYILRGTKFLNKTLHAYFKEEGIEHQTSTPRTPEQNGVVERQNHTLVEAARTMLSASKLPLSFWAEAVATACYTQNRSIIISTHGKMAYHIINDRKPSIKYLYIFGCICYITRDGENLDKMKEKGDPCVMFDVIKEMMSDHNSSDLAPQRQEMSVENVSSGLVPQGQKASDYVNSGPVPPRQNVVPIAEKTDSSQQGLEFLFSPLLKEYYNPIHGQAEENNNDQTLNASFQEDEFINPFGT
ncbi:retrovirus-related pol polyprotein from transposon TNT 1-94 [Tanacetum coccineum]